MKRLLLVLTLIIGLAAPLFAEGVEVHSVRVATSVAPVAPSFQFEFTSGMLNTTAELITNSSAEIYKNTNYSEFGTNETAVEVADISRNNIRLLFTAKLANRAKSNDSYTLRFIAGGFDVTRASVPGTLDPSAREVGLAEDLAARGGVSAVVSNSEDSVRLTFNGSECAEGDLATFAVSYNADRTIDSVKDGYYYTDISLEISSDF